MPHTLKVQAFAPQSKDTVEHDVYVDEMHVGSNPWKGGGCSRAKSVCLGCDALRAVLSFLDPQLAAGKVTLISREFDSLGFGPPSVVFSTHRLAVGAQMEGKPHSVLRNRRPEVTFFAGIRVAAGGNGLAIWGVAAEAGLVAAVEPGTPSTWMYGHAKAEALATERRHFEGPVFGRVGLIVAELQFAIHRPKTNAMTTPSGVLMVVTW